METKLIESALQLTGKTMEDMTEPEFVHRTQGFPKLYHGRINWLFSIKNFCYYLLSPEFINKYIEINDIIPSEGVVAFARSIYEYQYGNKKHLIELLTKIQPGKKL